MALTFWPSHSAVPRPSHTRGPPCHCHCRAEAGGTGCLGQGECTALQCLGKKRPPPMCRPPAPAALSRPPPPPHLECRSQLPALVSHAPGLHSADGAALGGVGVGVRPASAPTELQSVQAWPRGAQPFKGALLQQTELLAGGGQGCTHPQVARVEAKGPPVSVNSARSSLPRRMQPGRTAVLEGGLLAPAGRCTAVDYLTGWGPSNRLNRPALCQSPRGTASAPQSPHNASLAKPRPHLGGPAPRAGAAGRRAAGGRRQVGGGGCRGLAGAAGQSPRWWARERQLRNASASSR